MNSRIRVNAGAVEHRNYTLLHDKPNPLMTCMTYEETLMGHLVMGGNHYSEIEYDGGGRVIALWPLRPQCMIGIRRPETGRLIYDYQPLTGPSVPLPMENVLHIRSFSPDGIMGYNTALLAKETIALGMAAEQFAARFSLRRFHAADGPEGAGKGQQRDPGRPGQLLEGYLRRPFARGRYRHPAGRPRALQNRRGSRVSPDAGYPGVPG